MYDTIEFAFVDFLNRTDWKLWELFACCAAFLIIPWIIFRLDKKGRYFDSYSAALAVWFAILLSLFVVALVASAVIYAISNRIYRVFIGVFLFGAVFVIFVLLIISKVKKDKKRSKGGDE